VDGVTARVLINGLGSTPQDAFAAGVRARTEAILISGAPLLPRTVIFRGAAGTPEWFRAAVPANQALYLPLAFVIPAQGVEVLTADAGGDVSVCFFYNLLP